MKLLDFLRFNKATPPSKPPKGKVDLKFDPEQDAFVRVDPDGTKTPLGVASQEEIVGAITDAPDFRDSIGAAAVPWAMDGMVAFWDWKDVELNSTKVVQMNDKTGNGWHISHSNNSTRADLTTLGIWPRGGIYDVANGGIPVDTRNWSFFWIGRDFTTEDPNSGQTGASGYIYSLAGNGRPQLGWAGAYHVNHGTTGSTDLYAPGPIFSPNGQPSILGQAFSSTGVTYYANGSVNVKSAFGVTTGDLLTKIFGRAAGDLPSYRVTLAMGVVNRPLTNAEFAQIAAFYGCPTRAGGNMVYCFGSSTPNGQGAGQTQLGCVQSFADWIGASRNINSVGGAGWNGASDLLSTAGVCNVHRGFNNIHVFLPQSNDMANNISAATCLSKITTAITNIRAVDPYAKFILCPVTPRNASFTGISAANFDIQRLTFNAGLTGIALSQEGVVVCDIMSTVGMRNLADAGNGTLMDVDSIHLTASGHAEYAKSMNRGFLSFSAESKDINFNGLSSALSTWVLDNVRVNTGSGGTGGAGGSTSAPGRLLVDSGTTSGGYAIALMSGTNDTATLWTKRGDHPGRVDYTKRHRVYLKFSVFASTITGTGWGQFWSSDAFNSTNVGLPNKKGFGFRIVDSSGNKIQLMVHDGTTLSTGSAVAINTSVLSEIQLDLYQGVLYATLDGVVLAQLAGGPTTVTSTNEATPAFYAYADTGGSNKARWTILEVRSLTTDT